MQFFLLCSKYFAILCGKTHKQPIFWTLNYFICMKKLFSFFCCMLLSIAAWGDTTATVDGIKYILDGSNATVTYPNDSKPDDGSNASTYSGAITIPSTITVETVNYNVTAIGDYAFRSAGITSISLPEGLLSIGYKAIYKTGITQLTIPNSVTTLGQESIEENSNLTNITFGAHVADNPWGAWVCWRSSGAYNVYMICDAVPELADDITFDQKHQSTIHVYPNIYLKYKQDSYWAKYNIVGDLQKVYTYSDLQDAITSCKNILNNGIGTTPGYYTEVSSGALSSAIGAAELLTESATPQAISDAIRNMVEAVDAIPLVDGYYFIKNVYENRYMYTYPNAAAYWGIMTTGGSFDSTNAKFFFKLTRDGDRWIIQCPDENYNAWYLSGPSGNNNTEGEYLKITTDHENDHVITNVGPGQFKIQSVIGSELCLPYCVCSEWHEYARIREYTIGDEDESRMYWYLIPATTTNDFKGILTKSKVKDKIKDAVEGGDTYLKLDKYALFANDLISNMPSESNLLVKVKTGSSITGTNIINNKTCTNLVLTDGKPFGYTEDITATSATYSRNVSNTFGTICLPYAVSSNSDVQYYTLNNISGSTLYLTAQTDIEAGKPAIFEMKNNATTLTATATDATIKGSVPTAADATLKLIGTFNEQVITDAEELAKDYYISGDKFRQANSSLTVKPFRAYFTTTSGNNVKMFNLSVLEEEETAIDNVQCSMLNAQSIYDANGMELQSLRKGLNIVKLNNGNVQKIVVK